MSHDSSAQPVDSRPWYKQFWPWFIMILPAIAVVGGISTLIIAVKNADDVVADDWYKQGRGINRSMAEEDLAQRLGLSLTLTQSDQQARATLSSAQPLPWPNQLALALQHPTLAAQDTRIRLTHVADGQYTADTSLPSGRWQATLTPDSGNWRIQQVIILHAEGDTELRSRP